MFVTLPSVVALIKDNRLRPLAVKAFERSKLLPDVPTMTEVVPDNQRTTPAPIHAIRSLLQGLPDNTQPIVIGRHPIDWFIQETDDQLHSLLVECNALYLHGHEHRVRTRMGARGLVSLGFGAAYVAPIDGRSVPNLLVVRHATLLVTSLSELIAVAKAKPGRINFASSGNGTTLQFNGELLKKLANIDIVHVPFKGIAPALIAVMGGEVSMVFATFPAAL